MRININLASHPYEDAGDFYRRWGTALGVLVLLTLGLTGLVVHEWMSTHSISKQIAGIRKQINDLDDQKNREQAILNRSENRGTRDRSAFVNQLIAIKSFSWTQVLADMETLMPTRLHIVSIQPELDKESQLQVKIMAAGDSWEKGVELLKNLEKSRYFRKPVLTAIITPPNIPPGGDVAKFELDAYYVPPANVPQLHVPEKGKTPHSNKPATGRHPAVRNRAVRNRPAIPGSRGSTGE